MNKMSLNIQNQIIHGCAAAVLNQVPEESIDLVVTDPPYLVNYKDRSGRSLKNDSNPQGVMSVFKPMVRALKQNAYAICFAGWSALPLFTQAWDEAELRIVSEIVWKKPYISRRGFTCYQHETAYVLAKGYPGKPENPISSIQDWHYSGNRHHPTEKSVENIAPIIRCFSKPNDLVCDPFSGSGSTSVAAALNGRRYLGIDIDEQHCVTARTRLDGVARYHSRASAA